LVFDISNSEIFWVHFKIPLISVGVRHWPRLEIFTILRIIIIYF